MSAAEGDEEHQNELPDWVPEGVDITVPNAARIYDYFLGGYHNFAVDREYAERIAQAFPNSHKGAYANRAFLVRAIRWLIGAGIRQFLDVGSGIPTAGNVHEIVEGAAPDTRVMYVDIDPIAVAHTQAILSGHPRFGVVQADLRRPGEIIDHPDVRDLLDFTEPVAVVLVSVMHFISDNDDPYGIVARLREAVVPGSYIALAHGTKVTELAEELEAGKKLYKRTSTPTYPRSREEIARLLTGLDIVEPGIVPVTDWHPNPEAASETWPSVLAAVARKP
jgi:S-adenosyl methyltransferase